MVENINIGEIDSLYRSAEVVLPDIAPEEKRRSANDLAREGYRPVAGAIGNSAVSGAQALRLIGIPADGGLVAGPYVFGFGSPDADGLEIVDNGAMLYARHINIRET